MKKTSNKGNSRNINRKTFYASLCIFYLLFLTLFSGCGNKFFDPTQIGRFRPTPAVNVILNSLGVAEEEAIAWEGAEEPRPSDIVAIGSDYMFRSGDTIMISIYELFQEGTIYVNNYVVTETGKISIPDVGVVHAEGLTETQLEDEIKQILAPNLLKDPSVTATLAGSQQRTYSILGDGVAAPSRYVIPRYDYRLTDAIATAGGTRQFNVSNIYVSRNTRKQSESMSQPLELEVIEPEFPEIEMIRPQIDRPEELDELLEPEQEMFEVITPMARRRYQWPDSKVVIASTELATTKEYAQAGWTGSLGQNQTWDDLQKSQKPSTQMVSPEKTQESVSIKDILKTLSERNRQDRFDEQADTEDVMKSIAEPAVPERTEEPIDVEDILRSFSEPTYEVTEESIDIDETPGLFTKPEKKAADEYGTIAGPAITETTTERIDEEELGRIEWIFQDGKWIPVQVGPRIEPEPSMPVIEFEPRPVEVPPSTTTVMPDYEWAETEEQTRVIKIPADKLLAGDPRYNIVIQPGDSIFVPVDIIGEFCIMGNVNYQGYITITGRPLTLKMAIAAAGGLGPLAWPKKCEVIRRIGKDKEEIVMVDLDKIANGEQPDFFIKPNDLINVGTHATSIWRAVLRNAYRASYGFGFVYDRNFAYPDNYYGTTFMGMKQ